MSGKSKNIRRDLTISTVGAALMAHLEPVIKVLDQHHNFSADNGADSGHEAPSRKDGLLRILLNNFCRDVHQQIYGVNTENYKFAGVKDNWDRAQNAVAQLVNRYANNPEDMEADPNCGKFYAWYEQANAKMEMLSALLSDFTDLYKKITGEEWKYIAPGASTAKTRLAPSDAAKKLAEIAKKSSAQAAA